MCFFCLKQHYLFISYAVCFWFVCLLPVAVAATVRASSSPSPSAPLPFLRFRLLLVRCLVALSLPRQKLIFINSAHTQRGTHRSRKQASTLLPLLHTPTPLSSTLHSSCLSWPNYNRSLQRIPPIPVWTLCGLCGLICLGFDLALAKNPTKRGK